MTPRRHFRKENNHLPRPRHGRSQAGHRLSAAARPRRGAGAARRSAALGRAPRCRRQRGRRVGNRRRRAQLLGERPALGRDRTDRGRRLRLSAMAGLSAVERHRGNGRRDPVLGPADRRLPGPGIPELAEARKLRRITHVLVCRPRRGRSWRRARHSRSWPSRSASARPPGIASRPPKGRSWRRSRLTGTSWTPSASRNGAASRSATRRWSRASSSACGSRWAPGRSCRPPSGPPPASSTRRCVAAARKEGGRAAAVGAVPEPAPGKKAGARGPTPARGRSPAQAPRGRPAPMPPPPPPQMAPARPLPGPPPK